MLSKIKQWFGSIVNKNYITMELNSSDFEWDVYDKRDVQKTIDDLKNTLVDIPFYFCYEGDNDEDL